MAYWWVCQNKTGREEHQGGYLWAPHGNKKGQTFFHWENMDLVRPGDLIFSYIGKTITAVATAETDAYDSSRPFSSSAGQVWEREGRRIDVTYEWIDPPIHIDTLIDDLLPLMPERYAPLNAANRGGNVGYLYKLPEAAAGVLLWTLEVAGHSPVPAEPTIKPVPRVAKDIQAVWKARRRPPGGRGSGKASSGITRRSGRAKAIGDAAEEVVKDWLEEHLPTEQRQTVIWVAKKGRKPGWDIQYEADGRRIVVEVKGTTGASFPNVEVTANEWLAAERERESYRLCLVTHCESASPMLLWIEDPWGELLAGRLEAVPMVWRLDRLQHTV